MTILIFSPFLFDSETNVLNSSNFSTSVPDISWRAVIVIYEPFDYCEFDLIMFLLLYLLYPCDSNATHRGIIPA